MRHGNRDYGRRMGVKAMTSPWSGLPLGKDQAAAAGAAFAHMPLDIAVCSGLSRTRETAQIVLSHRIAPPALVDGPA
ncbi:histidine phosphatase family protein [Candidatus Phycosocius spiralis]|uniref:Histidine phosphatase family protein n=1 Tax=Candidatus Phycosocius spiralis TaxID=2815099 RepID=A0ABQ4PTF3_9PROT|nr:histidine phosphatase family protein [Candidatus Phycosocius spiralis]GIU66278.1 hypothetical protein PsB1_0432 [Candidatus Phycosocius spiralis]